MPRVTHSFLFLVALMATLVIAVGCGSAETRTVPAHADAARLVSYERTGGIAGVDDRVVVDAGGAVTVRHRDGVRHRTRLSARDMRALRRALVAAHFKRPVTAVPSGCADCFFFRLSHGGHTLSFSQLAAPARVNAVLRILTQVAEHS
jgi:hypothetical protein